MKSLRLLTLLLVFLLAPPAAKSEERVSSIKGGVFAPLYGNAKKKSVFRVKEFSIDKYPVTNQEFEKFISTHPDWKKGSVSKLLADANYLKHWRVIDASSEHSPALNEAEFPVTNISWFAAEEYCAVKGGRLPTVLEWEYVAAASAKQRDASKDPKFLQEILSWYSRPSNENSLHPIGQNQPNYWGLYDMHGLVWEWNYDFNSVFVTGDNRQEKDDLKNLFCGAGAEGANNKENYAAFMRYALRNSLKANYTMESLGFRCAYDKKHKHN